MTAVTLDKLSKTYPGVGKPSLDQLTLQINSGELTAFLGPSGCGKTTTMKLIAGLLEPSAGDVLFDGRSILHTKPEHRGVVMVFQNYLLFPYMSVADNIGFGLKMRKVDQAEINRRVGVMLELVKLPDLGKRRPADLSGGQQQRVALARALIVQPNVLLLDEPLSNLDAFLRFEMRDLIRSLQQELGITTIFVTHDQEEAVVLADKVALILDGRLRQYAAPEFFYRQPADEQTARFFGGQNFIKGTSDGTVFTCELGKLALTNKAQQGAGLLTVRPENIKLGTADNDNVLQAKITGQIYLGTHTRLILKIGTVELTALVNPEEAAGIAIGDKVSVSLPATALWVLTA